MPLVPLAAAPESSSVRRLSVQDFPLKADSPPGTARPSSDFEDSFVRYMQISWPQGATLRSGERVSAESLRLYDFSAAGAHLVPSVSVTRPPRKKPPFWLLTEVPSCLCCSQPANSLRFTALYKRRFSRLPLLLVRFQVPGNHRGDEMRKWGHMRVRALLEQETFSAAFAEPKIVIQTTSLVRIFSPPARQASRAMMGDSFDSSPDRISGSQHVSIPTTVAGEHVRQRQAGERAAAEGGGPDRLPLRRANLRRGRRSRRRPQQRRCIGVRAEEGGHSRVADEERGGGRYDVKNHQCARDDPGLCDQPDTHTPARLPSYLCGA